MPMRVREEVQKMPWGGSMNFRPGGALLKPTNLPLSDAPQRESNVSAVVQRFQQSCFLVVQRSGESPHLDEIKRSHRGRKWTGLAAKLSR